jgi:hypothetical protein
VRGAALRGQQHEALPQAVEGERHEPGLPDLLLFSVPRARAAASDPSLLIGIIAADRSPLNSSSQTNPAATPACSVGDP